MVPREHTVFAVNSSTAAGKKVKGIFNYVRPNKCRTYTYIYICTFSRVQNMYVGLYSVVMKSCHFHGTHTAKVPAEPIKRYGNVSVYVYIVQL